MGQRRIFQKNEQGDGHHLVALREKKDARVQFPHENHEQRQPGGDGSRLDERPGNFDDAIQNTDKLKQVDGEDENHTKEFHDDIPDWEKKLSKLEKK